MPPATRTEWAVLAGLAVLAAVLAVIVSRWLFPLYSINRDDSVYVAMARLLERGRATLPLDHEPFAPWAAGVVGDRIVVKYTPPWPGVLAAGHALTGTFRAGLALTAAGAVVAVHALAVEVLGGRRSALVAAGLMALCPLVVVQSATYLPYLFTLALACGASALVLAGVRRGSAARLAMAGALAGVAAFARPFDAVLTIAPVLVAVIVASRHDLGALRRPGLAFVAGVAPVLAAALVYNAVVMGGPLRLPFTVTGDADAFGFGRRGVFEASTIEFDLGDGWAGTAACLRWLVTWLPGGAVLVALAAWGVFGALRHGRGPGRWALTSWLVIVPLAYLAFWGPWAMSHNWDGVQTLGPFYHLPLVVPLVVFGGAGLVRLVERRRAAGGAAVVALVAVTAWAVPDKVARNDAVTERYRAAAAAVDAADLDDAILFAARRGESGFLSDTPFLENQPDLDQPVLYAVDCGPTADQAVLARFPGRSGFRLDEVGGRFVVRALDEPWPGSQPTCTP